MAYIPPKTIQIKNGQVEIGSLEVQDAEEVIELIKRLDTETDFLIREPGEFSLGIDAEKKFISSGIETDKNILIKATVDEEIVGTLGFTVPTNKRYSHKGQFGVALKKDYWGRGIGKALLDTMLQWCKEKKIEKVTLEVDTKNERAIQMYEKYGFQKEGYLVKDKKMSDGSYRDTLIMALLLIE